MASSHNYLLIIHPDTKSRDYSAGLLMILGKPYIQAGAAGETGRQGDYLASNPFEAITFSF